MTGSKMSCTSLYMNDDFNFVSTEKLKTNNLINCNPLVCGAKLKPTLRDWLSVERRQSQYWHLAMFMTACHGVSHDRLAKASAHHTAWSKYRWILAQNGHFLVDHWQKCFTMKNIHVVIFVFLCIVRCGIASIWIKNVISYGPSAANVGVKCLSKMSQLYLNGVTITRSRTLVVSYTRNLSIPADNIQRLYLKWLHEAIIYGELDEYFSFFHQFFSVSQTWNNFLIHIAFFSFNRMEVILISNAANASKDSHVQSNTIYEKDYYVLIMDDFNKVTRNTHWIET